MSDLTAEQAQSLVALVQDYPLLTELGRRFADAGFEVALVGGPVRDALLGREVNDLDFATSATPDEITGIIEGWADAIWDVGREFGTIGLRKGNLQLEITTYRSDTYDSESRKPQIAFGSTLAGDLSRRDFTVNAMAIRLPSLEFVDEFDGLEHLAARQLQTPVTAQQSFSDDPLRMMRAARFTSQLGFVPSPDVVEAMGSMTDRLSIVSAERIRDEFSKLLCGRHPVAGLRLLVDTGLSDIFLPELSALKLTNDEHHRHKDVYEHSLTVLTQAIDLEASRLDGGPDLIVRLASLLHDIGKPKTRRFEAGGIVTFHHHDVVGAKMTRKRLRAMRYPNDVIEPVALLVELHLRFHGYGSGDWTDSAVRRYVRDAGEELDRLHILTRADCTTRNRRKADTLQRTYDSLEARIATLREAEELDSMRPDLDGNQIMSILQIGPGREVGEAYKYLLDVRLENGPVGPERATELLRQWWADRS